MFVLVCCLALWLVCLCLVLCGLCVREWSVCSQDFMWSVCDVLYVCVSCCVVRECAVSLRYIDVCNCDVFSVVAFLAWVWSPSVIWLPWRHSPVSNWLCVRATAGYRIPRRLCCVTHAWMMESSVSGDWCKQLSRHRKPRARIPNAFLPLVGQP